MKTEIERLAADAQMYDRREATYGADPDDLEHSIPPALEEPYRLDLEAALKPFAAFRDVLEVRAGDGVLTRLLTSWCPRPHRITFGRGLSSSSSGCRG